MFCQGDIVIIPVPFTEDVSENLPTKSYIRFHKIFVLEQSLIKGKVSRLKKDKYQELVKEIKLIITSKQT